MDEVEILHSENAGLGLAVEDVPSVARRQLIGSLVAAAVIAAIAGATAFRPAHQDVAGLASHKSTGVQQATFATYGGERVATIKRHEIELP
jgi:hypothetical protein